MDTLVDETEHVSVGPLPAARMPAVPAIPAVARQDAMRPSMASIDGDVQVQWFERMRPPPVTYDVDLDVDIDLSLDVTLAPSDDDDPELDVPTGVWRRTRSIWTSED